MAWAGSLALSFTFRRSVAAQAVGLVWSTGADGRSSITSSSASTILLTKCVGGFTSVFNLPFGHSSVFKSEGPDSIVNPTVQGAEEYGHSSSLAEPVMSTLGGLPRMHENFINFITYSNPR